MEPQPKINLDVHASPEETHSTREFLEQVSAPLDGLTSKAQEQSPAPSDQTSSADILTPATQNSVVASFKHELNSGEQSDVFE